MDCWEWSPQWSFARRLYINGHRVNVLIQLSYVSLRLSINAYPGVQVKLRFRDNACRTLALLQWSFLWYLYYYLPTDVLLTNYPLIPNAAKIHTEFMLDGPWAAAVPHRVLKGVCWSQSSHCPPSNLRQVLRMSFCHCRDVTADRCLSPSPAANPVIQRHTITDHI